MTEQNINFQLKQNLLKEINMRIKELRQKPKDELLKLLQDKRSKAVQFKINISSGNIKNVRELRGKKKDIARILTLLKEYGKE